MCYIDFYERTKIHYPMMLSGALLIITSVFMITLGIAREREDVWVAGILVAIVAAPVFIFGLFVFCYLNCPGRIPGFEQDFSVSKFSIPTTANVQPLHQFFYPITGYDLSSRVYQGTYTSLSNQRTPTQPQTPV